MKFRLVGTVLFHADRPTNMIKPLVYLRNFANAPKSGKIMCETNPALRFLQVTPLV